MFTLQSCFKSKTRPFAPICNTLIKGGGAPHGRPWEPRDAVRGLGSLGVYFCGRSRIATHSSLVVSFFSISSSFQPGHSRTCRDGGGDSCMYASQLACYPLSRLMPHTRHRSSPRTTRRRTSVRASRHNQQHQLSDPLPRVCR